MSAEKIKDAPGGSFHLNKWFLDFVGENGEAMIFYAAKLRWHGWLVSYASFLHYDEAAKVSLRSRFSKVQLPQINDDIIIWGDTKFRASGTWKPMAEMIQARIYDSAEGYLDWNCFQPASEVQIKLNDRILEGRGYAEQLILTIPPWKIPMDELRWGRFGSVENNMVWIEIREKCKRQWLWLNGENIENCIIEDDYISLPGKDMILKLDRGVVLESEKKIFSVGEKLVRYIPGFNKVMPLNFLMADEIKWLSRCQLKMHGNVISGGMAIHELVNFKAFSQ